ncbi:MAG: TPM domain-containing protein [Clostridia bacterium]|nr:TPM domain-containing protein [Clostridia bacterium]
MKRNAKTLISVIFIAVMLVSLAAPVFADAPYWWKTERPFPNFTAENPPRVVDDADLLTDDEEALLSKEIGDMCEKYNFSYVLFTDDDLHEDLTNETRDYHKENKYAADFLYFNGYGIGSNYSATVLFHFIVTEDDGSLYRGWTTISIGDNESIFTEDRINYVDDLVEPYFRSGDYLNAYLTHVRYVESLLSDMYDLPDWYPENTVLSSLNRSGRTYAQTLNSSKQHVYDNAGMLSSSEAARLDQTIKSVCEKTGKDIYVFTDNGSHTLSVKDYGSDFYYFNGGYKDGIILSLVRDGYITKFRTVGFGAGDVVEDSEIDDRFYDDWSGYDDDLASALTKYVSNAEYALKHNGRMPMQGGTIVAIVIISLVVGLIFAAIRNSSLMKGMKLVPQRYAARYLRAGSLSITNRQDAFLYRTVSRVAKPRDTGSSGGGGGHSSYSGGHSSGGGHYSGGGRHY